MAKLDRIDVALYCFYAVFLATACICYVWEVWDLEPWSRLCRGLRKMRGKFKKVFIEAKTPSGHQGKISTDVEKQESSEKEHHGVARHDLSPGSDAKDDQPGLTQVPPRTGQSRGKGPTPKKASIHDTLRRAMTWIPGILWLLPMIFALVRLAHPPGVSTQQLSDIGGIGVRVGLYIPVGLAVLTLLAGHWHKEDSGAKEIGGAQLLSLLYLNFNAVKASHGRFRGLTFPDVVVACICFDLTAAGLHMTKSGKVSLSARWFVVACAVNQLVALSIVIAMLARIRHNYLDKPDVYVIWWGLISSRSGPSGSTWTYVAIRSLILAHGLWLDWRHSPDFHTIEKDWAELAPGDQSTDKLLKDYSTYEYATLRATVFSKWIEWIPSVVVAIASLERMIRRLPSDSLITDWGQSAALVLAIAGGVHWLYVVYQVFLELREEDNRCKRPTNFPRYGREWRPGNTGTAEVLLKAAKDGDVKVVRQALRRDAPIDAVDDDSPRTALLYTVARDDYQLVLELLSRKHHANPVVEATPPAISLAAELGKTKVLAYLLKHPRIDPWQLDAHHRTPLWLAAQAGRTEAVETILGAWADRLEAGGEPSRLDPMASDENGVPPLYAAADTAHVATTQLLVDWLKTRHLEEAFIPPLVRAIEKNQPATLKALLNCGLSALTVYDTQGSSLLHLASQRTKWVDVIKVLGFAYPAQGADIDYTANATNSPLWNAVLAGCPHNVETLYYFNADPFWQNSSGDTPFAIAVRKRKIKVLDRLFHHFNYDRRDSRKKRNHQKLPAALCKLGETDAVWLVMKLYISAHELFEDKPLVLHALHGSSHALFVALIGAGSVWPQGAIDDFKIRRPKDLSVTDIAIRAQVKGVFQGMSDNNQQRCEYTMRRRGGSQYLES